MVREPEGISLVMRAEDADLDDLPYEEVMSWITLNVHSSLSAVGLTAAISAALTERGVSCNVIAGYHHDHILVPQEHQGRAIEALQALSRNSRR